MNPRYTQAFAEMQQDPDRFTAKYAVNIQIHPINYCLN